MAQKKKIKFVKNVCYEGTDYGPSYKEDTVDADAQWAARFISSGRAVEVKEKKEK